MIQLAAKLTGVVLLAVGILGFVPGITTNEHLLGVFHVNTAHSIIHLLSGAAALTAGLTNVKASRLYFRIFGVVYGLVAILGFVYGDRPILGLVSNNMEDTLLHLAIATFALAISFGFKSPTKKA